MSEFVSICEVGPRDGLQIAKTRMTTGDKVRWIVAIAAAGVREIEVGSFVPARVIPQLADTPEIVASVLETCPGLTVQALAPNLRGVQNAYNAGVHKISIPVSVSEGHSRANLNRAPAEFDRDDARHHGLAEGTAAQGAGGGRVLHGVRVLHRRRGDHGADGGDGEGSGRCRGGRDHAGRHGRLRPSGADQGGGARHPRGDRSGTLYGLHLHDTCGLGIANALAGLEEGIRAFDSCLAGLGGCPYAPGASGNVVTEDLVFMLESMNYRTGIDIPKLFEARRLLHEGLPAEPLHGQLPKAGIPPTFRKAA